MVEPLRISPDFYGEPAIVAASGPSLTPEVVSRCRRARWFAGWRVLVVNDAYRLMPWADALYAADWQWWVAQQGARAFSGQRWTSTSSADQLFCDNKTEYDTRQYELRLVAARSGDGFSDDVNFIHYGEPPHSGFQAVNLAILLGAKRLVLVGFDYRFRDGQSHYFGDHDPQLRQQNEHELKDLTRAFNRAHAPIEIVNATPESALTEFPQATLDEALGEHCRVHRDRPEPDARAD